MMHQGNFLPADLLMDFCVLTIVQLSFGRLNLKRLLAAHIFLTAATFAVFALSGGRIPVFIHIPVFILSAAVAGGARTPARMIASAACMLCAYASAAGFALLTGSTALIPAAAGIMLFPLLLRKQRNIKYLWNIELSVEKDSLYASFPALVDTGNRLHEHRSGLPVLIVEADAMPRIAAHVADLPDDQKRSLSFGVLGGEGEVSAFRPDNVCILERGGNPIHAPACWVAVYPGKIPGIHRALAPPEFAEAAFGRPSPFNFIHDGARRFYHGIFKR